MPPNTVKVDRSTKWGNIFIPGKENPLIPGSIVKDKRHAWQLHRAHAAHNPQLIAAAKAELRGKNIGCWCELPTDPYEPDICHGATLLEISNG